MNKTLCWWLRQLPENLRKKAKYNALTHSFYDTLDSSVESMSDAINRGFRWTDTPEGHMFWRDRYAEYWQPGDKLVEEFPKTNPK